MTKHLPVRGQNFWDVLVGISVCFAWIHKTRKGEPQRDIHQGMIARVIGLILAITRHAATQTPSQQMGRRLSFFLKKGRSAYCTSRHTELNCCRGRLQGMTCQWVSIALPEQAEQQCILCTYLPIVYALPVRKARLCGSAAFLGLHKPTHKLRSYQPHGDDGLPLSWTERETVRRLNFSHRYITPLK